MVQTTRSTNVKTKIVSISSKMFQANKCILKMQSENLVSKWFKYIIYLSTLAIKFIVLETIMCILVPSNVITP